MVATHSSPSTGKNSPGWRRAPACRPRSSFRSSASRPATAANTGKYPSSTRCTRWHLPTRAPATPPRPIARTVARQFFRDELAQLFALGKEENLDIATLTGSYAGAMGWGQFMPSSYREFAVDGDGDGKRDLFSNLDDVFSSVANYFVQKGGERGGWVRGGAVVARAKRQPRPPISIPRPRRPTTRWPSSPSAAIARWSRWRRPRPPRCSSLEGGAGKEHWLGFRNFYAITRYNISKMYAMAVYQLSEAIAGARDPQPRVKPAHEVAAALLALSLAACAAHRRSPAAASGEAGRRTPRCRDRTRPEPQDARIMRRRRRT